MIKLYTYKGCGTCKKALKHLQKKGVAYEEIPIREKPPTKGELKTMLKSYRGELKRLFNTSGRDYRSLNIKEKLPSMTEKEALDLLASNGNLIKRPFLLAPTAHLVGFKAEEWAENGL